MALAPTAATISVSDTLHLLDGPFAAFAQGVVEDRYAFWLGSGISMGRVDGLKKVIPRVLEFIRAQIVSGDPNCKFKKAFEEAIGIAHLSAEEQARVDLTRPFPEWADADAIVAMRSSY